ncbi:hypothetical protein HPB47_015886 [Ixodes persulcatus]|uniref:Uncharacterized protein n=1 Tax=Ixodes persulcatus TaxID=34615 RepID=A0AC60QSD4_IXOPE|nr:hypothetical protein HPB47_015886 [Ixodes persulcatus]
MQMTLMSVARGDIASGVRQGLSQHLHIRKGLKLPMSEEKEASEILHYYVSMDAGAVVPFAALVEGKRPKVAKEIIEGNVVMREKMEALKYDFMDANQEIYGTGAHHPFSWDGIC